MDVVTITLNPALDLTVSVEALQLNAVNRAQAMQIDPGGKGVNVASFLADAGYAVTATGFLGESNTTRFEQLCARKAITEAFIRVPGETRTGIKIVDPARQQTTDINMPGAAPPEAAVSALRSTLDACAQSSPWFVLSGSMPPGLPSDFYATLIARLKAQGRAIVLDTSGEALVKGVQAGPTIIKPNISELEQLMAQPPATHAELRSAARELLAYGIEIVVVSMGARGALFVNAAESWLAIPPRVPSRSTVGAGDAMVAGLVAAQIQGLDLAASARLATAYAVGAITRLGPHLPAPEELEAYYRQVVVQPPEGLDVA